MNDLISRKDAISAIWKALYEYEDKTEKQFQESDELDLSEWLMNDRMWVQNGHNLCVDVLANLPSAQPDYKTDHGYMWICPKCGLVIHSDFDNCVRCGHER